MRYLLLSVLVVCVIGVMVPSVFADNHTMPYWIKNNAGWWADGQIGDAEFLDSMEFLISQDLITIDANLSSSRQSDSNIPGWIKNNAGWWANGQIDDATFQSGLEYLAESNILGVSEYGFSSGYIGMLKTIDKNGVTVEFSTVDLKETVTSGTITDHDAGGAFDTSLIMPHSTYSITFEESGTYNFFSMVHPWHIGSIEITDFDLGPMKQEQERLEQERIEQERIEQERLEQERIEQMQVIQQEQEDPFLQQNPNQDAADMAERLGLTVEPTGNLDKLIPGEWSVFDEVYFALEYPISDEVPAIEMYTATVSHAGVHAGVAFYKHSSNDIAKQFRNELAIQNRYYLSQYDDVSLTSDSSCKGGMFADLPVLICSKNDVVVYVVGNGNISKLTKAILGNIKSPFMPIETFGGSMTATSPTTYIIIGAVAIGGAIVGVIAATKRGSKTPKPVKQKPAKKKETSVFCENCGNTLNPKAKFCGKCGNQV